MKGKVAILRDEDFASDVIDQGRVLLIGVQRLAVAFSERLNPRSYRLSVAVVPAFTNGK
jgi:hypothetical protein